MKNTKNILNNLILSLTSLLLFIIFIEVIFTINKQYNLISHPFKPKFSGYINPYNQELPTLLNSRFNKKWSIKKHDPTTKKDKLINSDQRSYIELTTSDIESLRHYRAGTSFRQKATTSHSKKLIYDVNYTVDKFGRRLLPRSEKATQHLLLLGGSFTWGEGVNNNETFAASLQNRLPNYQAYINARPGFAANDIYETIHHNGWTIKGIKETTGIAIYFLIEDHFNRILPTSKIILNKKYLEPKPYYKVIGNELKFIDHFKKSLYYKFIKILSYSETLRFFKISSPLFHKKTSVNLMHKLLLEIESELQKKLNTKELILVILNKHEYGESLKQKWINDNKTVIDLSNYKFNSTKNIDYFYPVSPHPRPRTHWLYSELITEGLKKYGLK